MASRTIAVLLATAIAAVVLALLGAGWIAVTTVAAFGVFVAGIILWWFGLGSPRHWDEIGRAIMVSVVLALVIGIPQYLISQRQKERDLELSELQKERDFALSLTRQDDLTGADLRGKDLAGIRLEGKQLVHADLRDAKMRGSSLIGTNLSGADLSRADLRDADLRRTTLVDATLVETDLRRATLRRADFRRANARSVKLQQADLLNANFISACLADAHLQRASLEGADFTGAVLTSADLRGARFEYDLRPARLDQAALARARYDRDTVWPLGFQPELRVIGIPAGVEREALMPASARISARVVRVVDGDTLQIAADLPFRSLLPAPGRTRLIGVNAPDLDQPGGQAARRFIVNQLQHVDHVRIQVGTPPKDDGSRWLVYVWLPSGKLLNESLLKGGYTSLRLQDRMFSAELWAAELRAKQKGVRLWRDCPMQPPYQYLQRNQISPR